MPDVWTRTSNGWATGQILHPENGPTGSVGSNGNVILSYGPRADLLNTDGSSKPINVDGHAAPAQAGDALYGSNISFGPDRAGDLLAYNPTTNRAAPVPATPTIVTRYAARWGPDGRLWVEGWSSDQQVVVAWSDDGGTSWTSHVMSSGNSYPGDSPSAAARSPPSLGQATTRARSATPASSATIKDTPGSPSIDPTNPNGSSPKGTSAARQATRSSRTVRSCSSTAGPIHSGQPPATGCPSHQIPTPVPVSAVQTNGNLIWAARGRQPQNDPRVHRPRPPLAKRHSEVRTSPTCRSSAPPRDEGELSGAGLAGSPDIASTTAPALPSDERRNGSGKAKSSPYNHEWDKYVPATPSCAYPSSLTDTSVASQAPERPLAPPGQRRGRGPASRKWAARCALIDSAIPVVTSSPQMVRKRSSQDPRPPTMPSGAAAAFAQVRRYFPMRSDPDHQPLDTRGNVPLLLLDRSISAGQRPIRHRCAADAWPRTAVRRPTVPAR